MRVPEKSKHAKISTKLSDALLFYDTSNCKGEATFSYKTLLFWSAMRPLQRLKSVKAAALLAGV